MVGTHCEERHTDKSVIMTVAGAANLRIDYNAFGKGDGEMCTLFEEVAKESETRGMEQGIKQGIQALIERFWKLDNPYQTARSI